jgi:uncharacterized membrane protein YhaH (DUF805 family)
MELMLQPIRKYADFQGRARRSEYWSFVLMIFGIEIVLAVVFNVLGGGMGGGFSPAALIVGCIYFLGLLYLFVPSIALAFRRLHDTDRSAWWLLVALIPVLGALALLVFYLLDGTPGPNRFGQDPKGRGLTDAAVFS